MDEILQPIARDWTGLKSPKILILPTGSSSSMTESEGLAMPSRTGVSPQDSRVPVQQPRRIWGVHLDSESGLSGMGALQQPRI